MQGLPPVSFHKRPLPDSLIAFSSKEGKRIFQEALLSGGAESYFPLSEQFITQSEPSFCSLTSLAMVLNALNHDPKKTWKGVWRWISEETLQCELPAKCGHSLDKVKVTGMNFGEFEALAKCHDVSISSYRASRLDDKDGQLRGLENFRAIVAGTSQSSCAKAFVVCNFSRPHLGQTGDGHFSPIGAYHKERDLVLVMDVARFKYPPFWVGLRTLWEAMSEVDAETGLPRGFFVISTRASSASALQQPPTKSACSDAR
jgi:glutathione gamma-glutamylcysteinyltransferase